MIVAEIRKITVTADSNTDTPLSLETCSPTISSNVFSLVMVSLYLNLKLCQNAFLPFFLHCAHLLYLYQAIRYFDRQQTLFLIQFDDKFLVGRQQKFLAILLNGKKDIHRTVIHRHNLAQLTMIHIFHLKANKIVPVGISSESSSSPTYFFGK